MCVCKAIIDYRLLIFNLLEQGDLPTASVASEEVPKPKKKRKKKQLEGMGQKGEKQPKKKRKKEDKTDDSSKDADALGKKTQFERRNIRYFNLLSLVADGNCSLQSGCV